MKGMKKNEKGGWTYNGFVFFDDPWGGWVGLRGAAWNERGILIEEGDVRVSALTLKEGREIVDTFLATGYHRDAKVLKETAKGQVMNVKRLT